VKSKISKTRLVVLNCLLIEAKLLMLGRWRVLWKRNWNAFLSNETTSNKDAS